MLERCFRSKRFGLRTRCWRVHRMLAAKSFCELRSCRASFSTAPFLTICQIKSRVLFKSPATAGLLCLTSGTPKQRPAPPKR